MRGDGPLRLFCDCWRDLPSHAIVEGFASEASRDVLRLLSAGGSSGSCAQSAAVEAEEKEEVLVLWGVKTDVEFKASLSKG